MVLIKFIKLNTRLYCSYVIVQEIRLVVYKLQLLEGSTIHPIFHVFAKNKNGKQCNSFLSIARVDEYGRVKVYPLAISNRKIIKKDNRVMVMGLMQSVAELKGGKQRSGPL
jgi:hypothetical protein